MVSCGICGDGICQPPETSASCPSDCPIIIVRPRCGDGTCNGRETTVSCPGDCGSRCGDGACNGEEATSTCPGDCGSRCGDDVCNGSEATSTCPGDCGSRCGDGVCNGSEATYTCAADCGSRCGDGVCNGSETAASCVTDCDVRHDAPFQETLLQDGGGWKLKTISGSAIDLATGQTRTFNENYWTLDASGIQDSPLSDTLKAELASEAADPNVALTLSAAIVAGIDQSLAQGSLTPELAAIAEPLDGQPLSGFAGAAAGPREASLLGSCSDRVHTYSRSFAVSRPFMFSTNPGSGFSGTLSGNGDIQTNATGELQIVEKRAKVWFVCIPYGVRFDYVRAFGTASIGYGATVTGTASLSRSWEWEIAKIDLFSAKFSIGPLPVFVGFRLPISMGLDLQASATGSLTYTGSQRASGPFDYRCTSSGCSGTSNFTQSGPSSPQIGTAQVTGRVQPSLWFQAAVRGYLYDESFAYAQLGLRGFLHADLWGYLGNGCGDADQDGLADSVDALTLDLDVQAFLTGQAAALGGRASHWNDLWHSSRLHLSFRDFIGSDALRPLTMGPSSVAPGRAQSYAAMMRPCYPYPDTISYQWGWGDNTALTTFSGAPQSSTSVSHTWASAGTTSIALTALRDSHGRVFNQTTSRNLRIAAGTWTPWLDRDDPNLNGDFETRVDFGSQVPCSNPIAIECKTLTGVDYTQTGEVYSCTPSVGGVCRRADQPDGTCFDYQVRFLCP